MERINIFLRIFISLICISLLFLPEFTYYDSPTEEYWNHNSILDDDMELAIFYLPFIFLWFLHLFWKKGSIKTFMIYGLLIYSLLFLVAAFHDFITGVYKILPIQLPHVSAPLLPIMISYWKTSTPAKINGT